MKKGDTVKVVSATDETTNLDYIGKLGIVESFNTNGATGNTVADPLVEVLFEDGTKESFWNEELELILTN